MAVPVWHPSLTKHQAADIERVQKLAFKIILQDRYVDYELACKTFETETLEDRRTKLCYRLAVKNSKSENSFSLKKTQMLTQDITERVFMSTNTTLVDSEKVAFHIWQVC